MDNIKKDVAFSLALVVICGFIMFFIVGNLSQGSTAFATIAPFAKYILIIFPILCVVGMLAVYFVKRFIPSLLQVAKFVLVGGTNFLVDMGVLNFLIFSTGIATGWYQTLFKATSFFVAVVNSFFWNKHWVFDKKTESKSGKEFIKFVIVSVVGFAINIGLDKILVDYIGPVNSMDKNLWAQLSAMISSAIALFWNFAGYKFIVFEPKENATNGETSAL